MGRDSVNKAYNQVKKFHEACGVEMPKKPTLLSGAGEETNLVWSEELEGISHKLKQRTDIGGEVRKRAAYILEELAEFLNSETIEDQSDALTDLIYFAIGTFTLMGVKPEQIFDIVANANLGKIMPDGTVLRNEQGKIQKPEGWKEKYGPEQKIREEIESQRRTATCKTCNGTSQPIYGLRCIDCE